jgi:tRNA A37 threonylcarbamoyladenosine dehydratase
MSTPAEKFARTELAMGAEALEKLRQARVAVVGLGAVGSFALEALVRSGVGEIVIADFDLVRETNFNRQLYAVDSNLGKPKVTAAAERIKDINPACTVHALEIFIDRETVKQVLALKPHVVVDAIDSMNPKIELLTACVKAGIPAVASMGAGNKFDPTQVKIGELGETVHCPLARNIRSRLKKMGITSGVRCVYSTEIPVKKYGKEEEDYYRRGRLRRPIGSTSYLPGIFGLAAAAEVIHLLTR